MTNKTLKYLVHIVLIFSIISCDYQNEDIPTNPQAVVPVGVIGNLDPNELTGPLQLFYDQFVVVKKDERGAIDTQVDYQKMLDLYNAKDQDYLELTESIRKLIALSDLKNATLAEKKAFYINAYNFLIIDKIIEKSGKTLVSSVLDIDNLGFDIFTSRIFTVAGFSGNPSIKAVNNDIAIGNSAVSLDDIEKKMLLKVLADGVNDYDSTLSEDGESLDARLHFAVICASKGCPVLYSEVFKADKLDQQLDEITRIGLLQDRVFKTVKAEADHKSGIYKKGDDITKISKIFFWYWDDFIEYAFEELDVLGDDYSDIIESYRQHFLEEDEIDSLELSHLKTKEDVNSNIELIDYSWKLNKLEEK